MQIIDLAKKGNLVRFYLGDTSKNYYGDDWDDRPFEHNAGTVYDEFILGQKDVAFDFDDVLITPDAGYLNSPYSKDDLKARVVPALVVIPADVYDKNWLAGEDGMRTQILDWANVPGVKAYYFGDELC